MDGATWTQNARVADAIDRSQDAGSGMVVLNTWDPEEFEQLLVELLGICSDYEYFSDRVREYWGEDDGSQPWAVQLCLCPH